MTVLVHCLVQRRGELLLRVHQRVDATLRRSLFECRAQRGVLLSNQVKTYFDQLDVHDAAADLDLGLGLVELRNHVVLLRVGVDALQNRRPRLLLLLRFVHLCLRVPGVFLLILVINLQHPVSLNEDLEQRTLPIQAKSAEVLFAVKGRRLGRDPAHEHPLDVFSLALEAKELNSRFEYFSGVNNAERIAVLMARNQSLET